ncbi:hypothetical protein GCM10010168_00110 [Actinoplanes ianthinogenes]|uniref:Copper(I)-binding protein n=1 Tax=Actinoplanes ianthinogenes TaxID=122358 RepID=A0ABM7LVD7_9ACTN|nr:hypothetical protein [Actinoplanes ianthinogenes]BCJ43247.1 hypothetical protein Aiant_39040 [Actinoplanes ianthinogenes]GGQ89294.1 hypothetical protein GCM10010168_00110 [Actinoplanes ianthinogenes]
MRSLVTRRAALVAGVATVGAIALAGCSAGQVAETAELVTPIAGVNAQSVDGAVFVRNAQITYNGIQGYAKGENAPLELSLYNQSEEDVTVSITSEPTDQPQVVSAKQVGFVTTPTPAPTGTAVPEVSGKPAASASGKPAASATPAATPTPVVTAAQIKLSPLGQALFRPTDANKLQVVGLSDNLRPGEKVNLVLHFSTGAADLHIQAPVAIPVTAASRAPGATGENSEHE